MKKVLSSLLALSMVFSLNVTAFAADKGSKDAKVGKDTKVEEISQRPGQVENPITAAEAEAAALEAAGVTRSEVKGLHVYKLYDRGIATSYRVEFGVYNREAHQTTVYRYVVDLATGEVA